MAGQAHVKIEKVEKLSATEKPASLENHAAEEQERVQPNKERFDGLMTGNKANEAGSTRRIDTGKVSLAEEIATVGKRADKATSASPELFVAQAQEVMGKIEELKTKLNTPNLEIKGSIQNLLQNKLSHIDESLKVALSKAGVEYQSPIDAGSVKQTPIERFLGFLTDSQHRLENISNEVYAAHLNRKEISPVTMLAMQVKVGYVQQELEFFTGLLNKALESTKTIMNVQV